MALKIISIKKQETDQPIKVETREEIVAQTDVSAQTEASLSVNKTDSTAASAALECEKLIIPIL